jgi:hypothetical protein
MSFELSLGSLPKTGAPAPLAWLSYLRERFAGAIVKFRNGKLNHKALSSHLALNRRQSFELDDFCKQIDLNKTSVGMSVWPDGTCSVAALKDVTYPFNGVQRPGVTVIHRCDFEPDGLSLVTSAAWPFVLKGAPDQGHIVYCVTTYSEGRFLAMQKSDGKLPMPTEVKPEVLDTQRGGAVPTYIGMTSKGMAIRLQQHIYSAYSGGSSTRFHKTLRGDKYAPQLPAVTAVRMLETRAGAFAAEAEEIKTAGDLPGVRLLNALLSGEALEQLFAKAPELRGKVDQEYAEERLNAMSSGMTLKWQDPDYAEAVICNNDRNLDADTVREIRFLIGLGVSSSSIAVKLSLTPSRVNSVAAKKTYGRII